MTSSIVRCLGVMALFAATLCVAQPATAQRLPRRESTLPRPRANVQGVAPRAGNRLALERQIQQTLWRLTRQRVGLTDDQMRQLVPVNQRFESQRREILREERSARLGLRSALLDSSKADQQRVTAYIDQLLQLQRRRIDLLADEQRELARFMTPVQRARYLALQEQVRRRVEQLRRRERLGTAVDSLARRPPPEP